MTTAPKPSLFHEPGLWLAWGLQAGGRFTDLREAVALVDRAANHGVKWIVAQPPFNGPALAALRSRCSLRGLHFGIWVVHPTDMNHDVTVYRPNLYVANVEAVKGATYGAQLKAFRAAHPQLPLGLVTNFGGFDMHGSECPDAEPWIRANAKILPEAYQMPSPQGNPQATPAAMVYESVKRGWHVSFPVLGCYDGYPLADYKLAGEGFSVYLAEEMTDQDWQTLKVLTRA